LIAINVAFDFNNDDATGGVEGENICNAATGNMSLTCDGEEWLSGKSFQIFPYQPFDLLLVEIRAEV
jgi:hypothetical protein